MKNLTRLMFLALALAFAGTAIAPGVAMARSTRGCDTNDNEGSDHGNGHDAYCDSQGYP